MKKIFFLAVVFAVCGAGMAFAACAGEDVRQKALEYALALRETAGKDPAGYAEFAAAYQLKAMELQKTPDDLEAYCKFYDAALKELEAFQEKR